MDGPVVTGAEMIRIIDEHGGMQWCINGVPRFLPLVSDSSELKLGTPLVRITANAKAPCHYKIASPLFRQHGGWAVVLEPDVLRNNYELPGLTRRDGSCGLFYVHTICRMHNGKIYKPINGVRFLLG